MEINNLTHNIIGCAYKVHNVLGPGFLEKVYENALKLELRNWASMFGNKSNSLSCTMAIKLASTILTSGSRGN